MHRNSKIQGATSKKSNFFHTNVQQKKNCLDYSCWQVSPRKLHLGNTILQPLPLMFLSDLLSPAHPPMVKTPFLKCGHLWGKTCYSQWLVEEMQSFNVSFEAWQGIVFFIVTREGELDPASLESKISGPEVQQLITKGTSCHHIFLTHTPCFFKDSICPSNYFIN